MVSAVLVDLLSPDSSFAVVAQDPPPPGQGEEFGEASPVALVVILLLASATALLVRSMSKRIRRLPTSFDPPDGPRAAAGTSHADGGRVTDGTRGTGRGGDGAPVEPPDAGGERA